MIAMFCVQIVLYRDKMKDIFEYLREHCSQINLIQNISGDKLCFHFWDISIIIEFIDMYICENVDIENMNFSVFENNEIADIYLQAVVPIRKNRAEMDWSISYTNLMIEIIRKMNFSFPNAVHGEVKCIDIYGSCFCETLDYGFQISINESYWEKEEIYSFVINRIDKNIHKIPMPDFYDTEKELKDNFEIRILNSNTKIRRLGHLKILLKMIKEQSKVPISKMNKKFEVYCQDYEQFLKQHKNQKGDVRVTKTGNSANPYIELAVSLGLIRKSAGAYEVGKVGKVYNILKEKIEKTDVNSFTLSKLDTTFFLELLLKEDYWFLYAILEQAAINPNIAYKNLKKDFKQILLGQIKEFIDEAQMDNSKEVLHLKMIERRISEWKRPEVYMEHVLMPRLNWLYDMDFIELKNDLSFQLTEMGKRLLFNLATWNDIALHKIVSPIAYIDNYFMKMIDFVFEMQNRRYTKQADDDFLRCLEDSFVLFKTLAPNRITFSLFTNYTKQMLFWNHSVIVDTEDVKRAFELKRVSNYIYKYQEQYKDGYVQKIK